MKLIYQLLCCGNFKWKDEVPKSPTGFEWAGEGSSRLLRQDQKRYEVFLLFIASFLNDRKNPKMGIVVFFAFLSFLLKEREERERTEKT